MKCLPAAFQVRIVERMIDTPPAARSTAAAAPADGIDWDAWADSLEDWPTRIADSAVELLSVAAPAITSRAHIDRIAALERLRAVVAGLQAAEEAAFADRQRREQRRAGVKTRDLGRGVAEQIGYARRISPVAAAHHLGVSLALRDRLPQALELLRSGQVSEAQCQILATKTSHLSVTDAKMVDAAISPRMDGWNRKATEQAVDRVAYEIDPKGFVDRRGKAEQDRRVWVRPAPDCMSMVSALLPATQGVAVYAALRKAAETGPGVGDGRGLGQLMADTLVERVTGQRMAHLVPVQINLTISSDSLMGGGNEPAWLQDYGPIPAEHARAIAAGDPVGDGEGLSSRGDVEEAKAWILRVLTEPITGVASNIDTRRRIFDGNARKFITLRDRACRQPFCTAPIRHADHVVPFRDGGETSIDNGQGLCERGNYVKDMPGWKTTKGGKPGEIITTTPTGHRYRTLPPHQTGLPRRTVRE